jgi:8-oxo-dGTP diphosphatase
MLIDKLAWIELQDKRILSTRSYGKDKYYIPGGKREPGETDAQALIREIQEELNVQLDKQTLKYVGTFEAQAHGHPEGVIVRMTCYTAGYTGTLEPGAEIELIRWFNFDEQSEIAGVDVIIFNYLHEKGLLQ